MTHLPVPDVLLERYLLGELPEARRVELDLRIKSDTTLRRRLDALRRSDAEILALLPAPPALAARPSPRASRPAPLRRLPRPAPWLRVAAPALATLALLAAGIHLGGPRSAAPADADTAVAVAAANDFDDIRLKGGEASLVIYRKTRGGAELLPPRSTARAGDTLQIFYQSREAAHGAIFSVDGNGNVTLHLPETEGPSARLERGGPQALPHAYLLDRAPRMERFYLVTSPEPFALGPVLEGLKGHLRESRNAPDSLPGLPPGFGQRTYTLFKAEPARRGARGSRP